MSQEYKEKTDAKLIDIAYNNLPYAAIASVVIALMLCIGLWSVSNRILLGIWFGLIVGTNVLRYIDARYQITASLKLTSGQWKRRFYLGLVISTLLWAFFILTFFPKDNILLQSFIIIMIAGLSAGAVASLSSYRQFFITFFVLFLTPLSFILYMQGSMHYTLLSIAMIIYMLLMMAMASKFNKNVLEIIRTNKLYRETERNLKRSEERVLKIFQQAPIGIFSFDKQLRISEYNQGLADIMQTTLEEIKDLDLNRLEGHTLHSDCIQNIFKGEDILYEGPYTTLVNKLELWIDVRGTPLYNEEGEIEGGLVVLIDVTDKKMKEEKINFLAFHDELTHLPNRSLLHDRLDQLLAHIERNHHFAALMFIDLDNFQTINDSLGHHIGDIVLKEFSTRVSNIIRKEDTFSRLGGDEFILLLSELSSEQLQAVNVTLQVSEKIHHAMEEVYKVENHSLHLTASIGVTLIDSDHNDKHDILKHADLAMYKAKDEGKNRTCFYEDEMASTVKKRLHLENDLHHAINNGELKLHYQPIVASKNNEVVCIEALLRYCKNDGTVIYPDDFIPIAEESGLIIPIGYWVVEEACRQFVQWRENGTVHIKNIAINISPKQFVQVDFIKRLVEIIQPYEIDFSVFELELTESVVICDIEQAIVKMNTLKELGFILSMDDFGTGYSSLSYLKNLPFDIIKIDKSFIQNILINDDDKILVNTILDICKKFNRKVIAEGIETQEHMDCLSESSCDYYQGYAISRPISAEALEEFLERRFETVNAVPVKSTPYLEMAFNSSS